jgi:hypothetical protein
VAREELESKVGAARGKVEVVDCGVDLGLFPVQPAPAGPPAFVCVGSLTERKNPLRLAHAFERLGEGNAHVRRRRAAPPAPGGAAGISVTGRVPHDEVPARLRGRARRLRAEPRRAVRPVAARGDGRRAPGGRDAGRRAAGVRDARIRGARRPGRASRRYSRASAAPPSCRARTTPPARLQRRTTSGGRRRGWRRFFSEPLEAGQPDLDERADLLLEPASRATSSACS